MLISKKGKPRGISNQKALYTVTVQGVVDSRWVFTDVCIGWPGSMTDDKILETSQISLGMNQGLLKDVWIVGNSGYPLMDCMLVPYAQQNLPAQRVFNERVGRVQRVTKEAFGLLKGRWRCLQEITEVKLQDLPVVLSACCVLHNICEISNEAMHPVDAIFEIFDDEIAPENRARLCNQEMKTSSCPNLNRETTSFPNFFTLYRDSDHDDDNTLHKRRKVYHSEDSEASETSPFKDILSPFVSFNEMNDNHYPVAGSFHEWDEMDLPRRPPSPNGSDTNVSVGSNQYSGDEDLFGEDEEVDEKAEYFINKFKQQLKSQRLDSVLR
ncbi:hypothetical protein Vadar_020046 [Vaccinium darrowii]|uniref:Uncharacterized protein n=1 Tax=Vaccinium darrowii TaxID=229202 RepID=A0ACB7YET1_9ERIC|nr:hypothetical protein Vadar_020046 [Vaccinium darrowii]